MANGGLVTKFNDYVLVLHDRKRKLPQRPTTLRAFSQFREMIYAHRLHTRSRM